jgi:hypothetical protein
MIPMAILLMNPSHSPPLLTKARTVIVLENAQVRLLLMQLKEMLLSCIEANALGYPKPNYSVPQLLLCPLLVQLYPPGSQMDVVFLKS